MFSPDDGWICPMCGRKNTTLTTRICSNPDCGTNAAYPTYASMYPNSGDLYSNSGNLYPNSGDLYSTQNLFHWTEEPGQVDTHPTTETIPSWSADDSVQCPHCDTTFTGPHASGNLTRHQKTSCTANRTGVLERHTFDIEPIQCPRCNASFKGPHAPGNLIRHKKTSCPKYQPYRYSCGIAGCGRFYDRSDALRAHQRSRHGARADQIDDNPSSEHGSGVLKFQKKPEDFDPSASHLYDELGSDSRQRNNYTPLQFPYETRIEKKFEVFHPNPSASNEDAENDDTESVRMLKELPVIDFEDVGTRFQSTLPQATSPDVNDEPSINASMEDDSKKDNSRIDGTESEHILREIPVHDFGDGGKSSFQSTLPQATSPDTNDELLIGASAEYEVESEGSSCIESVFSYADSTVSAITSGSTFESSNSFVQDLAALLWENMALRALCTEAIQHRDISLLRLQRNLHRLLKHFAAELKLEALSLVQRRAASFVAHNSRAVSEDIRKRTEMMNSRLSEQDESSCKGEIKNIQGEDQSDDEASVDEDPGEQARDHEEYSMSAAQQFIISSHALGNLLQDFQKFVHPTFASRLGSLVEGIGKVVTDSEKTRWATVSSILANEFQDCPPLQLRIHRVPSQTFSDRVKIYVEDWTGQLWNWWPASPAHRKPPLHWTRILWNCGCGEQRTETVPLEFARRLEGLVKQFASSRSPAGTSFRTSSTAASLQQQETTSQAPVEQGRPLPPDAHSRSQFQVSHGQSAYSQLQTQAQLIRRVLFVVYCKNDYHLAQILVDGLSTRDFFLKLRAEYFRLRGPFLQYFSVWQYAYCEFSQFEKFDEAAFSLKKKHDLPGKSNSDYEYQQNGMPPITPHEFNVRFSECADRLLVHRWFSLCSKTCICAKIRKKAHSNELLQFLPKKLTDFDESSEKRELFWGIDVHYKVSIIKIIIYNMSCTLPLVWFFLMWIFVWGHEGDLQNASVPLMAMLGLLTFFWGSFFASCGLTDNRHRGK